MIVSRIPPRQEGRIAIVTKRGVGCDGRERIVRRAMRERTAKVCGPGALAAGAKLAGLAFALRCAGDGDTKAGLTGASTQELVNTIAQGMPMLGFTCSDYCLRGLLHFPREAMGAAQAPGIPCALFFSRGRRKTRA